MLQFHSPLRCTPPLLFFINRKYEKEEFLYEVASSTGQSEITNRDKVIIYACFRLMEKEIAKMNIRRGIEKYSIDEVNESINNRKTNNL